MFELIIFIFIKVIPTKINKWRIKKKFKFQFKQSLENPNQIIFL